MNAAPQRSLLQAGSCVVALVGGGVVASATLILMVLTASLLLSNPVPAHITGFYVNQYTRGATVHVVYQYSVGSSVYESSRFCFPPIMTSVGRANELAKYYCTGANVDAFCVGWWPRLAVLDRWSPLPTVIILVFVGTIVVLQCIRIVLKKHQEMKSEDPKQPRSSAT